MSSSIIAWSKTVQNALRDQKGIDVPCGSCTECCHSHMFILVRPEDHDAKQAIPKALRFSAPGLPKGFEVMGFDEQGRCPMFQEGGCHIYDSRPLTCRQFDCRVYTATGTQPDEPNMSTIFNASQTFTFDTDPEHAMWVETLKRVVRYLNTLASENHPEVPKHSSIRAALAVTLMQHLPADVVLDDESLMQKINVELSQKENP